MSELKRFVVMGAGEVGRHLARSLSVEGHRVNLIDRDPDKRQLVEEQLDVAFVHGNGAHVPTLEAANVAGCDLFVAASSSDEANLAASLLAKRAGAQRSAVRLRTSEDVTRFSRLYESTFEADLLLSTQLLTTTRILNAVLGYNTLEVEYLAGGAIQVRRIQVEAGSRLCREPLSKVALPGSSLVLAFISEEEGLRVPTGDDRARPGEEALVLATDGVIDEVERSVGHSQPRLGTVVLAGGGSTARAVAQGLERQVGRIKIIEIDRARAEQLAAECPRYEVIHGDATDMSLLASESVGNARAFVALTSNDEVNLMACLLAEELGVPKMAALVRKSETSSLWKRVGLVDVVSPRQVAAERIHDYIASNYQPRIISFESGEAQFVQRKVVAQSAVAGARLRDIEIPQGLIVAAVIRNGRASVPRGDATLELGDDVILFVRKAEAGLVQLAFPGPESA